MYSVKKGFLLVDALISILCVAILAVLVSAAVRVHVGMHDRIIENINYSDESFNAELSSHSRCGLCEAGEEEDPY